MRTFVKGIIFTLLIWFSSAEAGVLELTLDVPSYKISQENGWTTIEIEGFSHTLVPGAPRLPAKSYLLLLPPDAVARDVEIVSSRDETLPGVYKIKEAPEYFPTVNKRDLIEEAKNVFESNHRKFYEEGQKFPEEFLWMSGKGSYRNYRYVKVSFVPFTYFPKQGKLIFHQSVTFRVIYDIVGDKGYAPGDPISLKRAKRLFFNWDQGKIWYQNQRKSRTTITYDFVIVTTDALLSSLNDFVDWKNSLGFSVNLVTIDWIESNYSGAELADKIRNFLVDKYLDWGIQYVLLVGDITDIPMKMTYPDSSDHSGGGGTPTDYYYADLTGNWDSDGDGYYGEYGQDDVDFVPEVIVGRIPWSSSGDVSAICSKLISTESDTSSWKRNSLLLAAMITFANENGNGWPATDGAALMEELMQYVLVDWVNTTMYEKSGLAPSSYPCSYPLNLSNVISQWGSNDYGIVGICCHGSHQGVWRKIWSSDDGDDIPEDNEMDWEYFLSTSEVTSLNNTHTPVGFICACGTGYPEEYNLGKALLRYGSSGVVAASRSAWVSVGWTHKNDGGAESIEYYYFHYMLNDSENIGDALYDSKVYYYNHFFWWGYASQQNQFDFNLYGDPSYHQQGAIPLPPDTTPPTVPALIAPLDGDTLPNSLVTFAWHPSEDSESGIQRYDLQYSTDASFSGADTIPVTDTTYSLNLGNSTYYWRVRAVDNADNLSPWSTVWQFTVAFPESTGAYWFSLYPDDPTPVTSYSPTEIGDTFTLHAWLFADAPDWEGIGGFTFCIGFDTLYLRADTMTWDMSTLGNYMFRGCRWPGDSLHQNPGQAMWYAAVCFGSLCMSSDSTFHHIGSITFEVVESPSRDSELVMVIDTLMYPPSNYSTMGDPGGLYTIWPEWHPFYLNLATGIGEKQAMGLSYYLEVSGSNPFRGEAHLTFGIPHREEVSVAVYDITGRLVKVLKEGIAEAGNHNLEWGGEDSQGRQIPSGVYFVVMRAGRFNSIKRLLLVR